MRRLLKASIRSQFVREAGWVYVLQFGSMLLPLLSFPYLTRTLGPAAWGALAFTNAFASYVAIFVAHGFDVSAMRDVSAAPKEPVVRGQILTSVFSTQLVLVVIATAIAIAVGVNLTVFRQYPILLWLGTTLGATQGLSLRWYFQGIGKLVQALAVAFLCQAGYVLLLFVYVHGTPDLAIVPALNIGAATASVIVLAFVARRTFVLASPTFRDVLHRLRLGGVYFLIVASTTLTSALSPIVVGIVASTRTVAYFAASSRITELTWQTVVPLLALALPKIASARSTPGTNPYRLPVAFSVGLIAWALVCAAGLTFFSTSIVSLIAGAQFLPAVTPLRLLAWTLPLIATGTSLSWFWLLPIRAERHLLPSVIIAATLNIVLGVLLVPRYGAVGMAGAVFIAESAKVLALVATTFRHRLRLRESLVSPPEVLLVTPQVGE